MCQCRYAFGVRSMCKIRPKGLTQSGPPITKEQPLNQKHINKKQNYSSMNCTFFYGSNTDDLQHYLNPTLQIVTHNSIFLKSVAQHRFKTSHKISFTFYKNINDTDTCLTLMLSFKSTSFWRRNKGSFCGSSLTKGVPGKRKRKQVNGVKL